MEAEEVLYYTLVLGLDCGLDGDDICRMYPAKTGDYVAAAVYAALEQREEALREALKSMIELWDDNEPDDSCACLGASDDCKFPPPCELCVARAALLEAASTDEEKKG